VAPVVFAELVAFCAGVLLLTGVLIVWRRDLRAIVRLLAVQGVALSLLVAVIGISTSVPELVAVALIVLALKGFALPVVLGRVAGPGGPGRVETPMINTTASLISVALLTTLAYLVSQPLKAAGSGPAVAAVPIGIALVLFGFLVLASRRHAISQLVGFLMLDNGIAAVAFLIAGGVPLVVELGASLDVLLVVLVLQVLSGRIRAEFGTLDLDDLSELKD
jgi:hydrogenase-4 component E